MINCSSCENYSITSVPHPSTILRGRCLSCVTEVCGWSTVRALILHLFKFCSKTSIDLFLKKCFSEVRDFQKYFFLSKIFFCCIFHLNFKIWTTLFCYFSQLNYNHEYIHNTHPPTRPPTRPARPPVRPSVRPYIHTQASPKVHFLKIFW